jgi:Undecaprenyl-phosphate glucose phosphotransferase
VHRIFTVHADSGRAGKGVGRYQRVRIVGSFSVSASRQPVLSALVPVQEGRSWSRRVAIDLVAFTDVLGIITTAFLAPFLYSVFYADVAVDLLRLTQLAFLAGLFAYLCLRHFGLYDIGYLHALPLLPLRIMAAIGIAFLVVFGIGMPFLPNSRHFWTWYAIWATAGTTWVIASRLIARWLLARMTATGLFDSRIAVYGAGRVAERLAAHIADPSLATRLVGNYDDRSSRDHHGDAYPVNGTLDDLIALGRRGGVDQIIIALPPSADRRTHDVARRLSQLPVSLHVCTHLASDLVDDLPTNGVSRLGPIGLMDIKTKPLSDWGRHVKAVEDAVIAALMLVLLAPLMAFIALAVKWDSPGPALFKQRRHGLNRRVIEVLKFRSMRVAEDGAAVKQATRDDPRVTRLGRFLRSTSLDELPQLINVLKGEMSLIGPRPHALVHDDHYGEMLEGYANRHRVKPGMTGWAQVNGFRGPTETPDKMQARVDHDLWYIDNWSLWLDLRILAMTVIVGLRHKNAL